jgi:hydrogenase maturation protease
MTAGSLSRDVRGPLTEATAPVLVLGLGNLLLEDDGVGLRLVEDLAKASAFGDGVEFVDGGTQGLALLPCLDGRSAVLVLDAIGLGQKPGTVHVLREGSPCGSMEQIRARRASTAHEGNALELFQTARMLGHDFAEVAVVGMEPANLRTGIGLSPEVEASVPEALAHAQQILEEMVQSYVFSNSR